VNKSTALAQRDQALAIAINVPIEDNVNAAAAWKKVVQQIRTNRAIIMWALATFLDLIGTAFLGLRILATVGVTHPPVGLDLLLTGLVTGAAQSRCTT
jgi:hypothetical protein